MDSEWPYIPKDSLNEWDTSVLNLISDEELSRFTFDGIKRRLGVHPESLSRALSRLEDQGIIEKHADGYKVTSQARKLLGSQPLNRRESGMQLLQTLLSPNVPIRQIVNDLAGKWFGTLRWLGYGETSEAITLKWITEDGGIQVDAAFSEGALTIEAKMLTEKNLNTALRASYQLMAHISRIYEKSARIQHVSYFTFFGYDPMLMWM